MLFVNVEKELSMLRIEEGQLVVRSNPIKCDHKYPSLHFSNNYGRAVRNVPINEENKHVFQVIQKYVKVKKQDVKHRVCAFVTILNDQYRFNILADQLHPDQWITIGFRGFSIEYYFDLKNKIVYEVFASAYDEVYPQTNNIFNHNHATVMSSDIDFQYLIETEIIKGYLELNDFEIDLTLNKEYQI